MELGPSDSGRTLTLPLGASITIRLSESGGTAFIWHVEKADGLVVEDRIEAPPAATNPGAQTGRVFTVTPQAAETTVLRLVRHRPWESAADGDAEFVLTIAAEPTAPGPNDP